MSTQSPFLGIDFGTSKSCMAWVNSDGKAEILKNARGEDKTPSVVYFGEGDDVLVGTSAEKMLEDPAQRRRVFGSVKRELASSSPISLPGNRLIRPVDVAAEILRKLRKDAEELHFQQPVLKAVITCPAEFDALERDAIVKAGKLAGFEEVRLLEEPVAAGLAYQRGGLKVGDHVLVYDLGGGTFDLAVLMRDAEQGYRLALEPRGIRSCGGDDFDRVLYDHLDGVALQALQRRIGPDGMLDKAFLHKCREAKEELTEQRRTQVTHHLSSEPGIVTFQHVVERSVLEELVRERVETTVRLTEALLKEAQANGCAVDTVVLIGGSVRVPLVIQQLKATLPVTPQRWEKQDVAVALGAAYYAARLWSNGAAVPNKTSVGPSRPDRKSGARPSPRAEKPTPAPTVVTVAADGSGDYTSLEKALAEVAAGGTIRLLPGEYRLAKALVVEKAVRLVGAGMDVTNVVGYFEPHVVKVAARGRLKAQGITFRPSGTTPADVLLADGELDLTECRLTGGVRDAQAVGGAGLVIAGNTAAKISRCRIENNQGSGIIVRDQAQPTLRQNQCTGNELSGIVVRDQGQPTLEGNTCQGNKQAGIGYIGTAAGAARQNQCTGNEWSGIHVGGQAQPTLEGNTCQGNKGAGIVYFGTTAGAARQNQCTGNDLSGIQVSEQAQPTLAGNTCQGNKQAGIVYFGTTAGAARQNRCVGNARSGIEVTEQAQPTLRQNQCTGNELSGIHVEGQAKPTLEDNSCQGNKDAGIIYFGTAAGMARQNQCTGNELSGIQVSEQAQPALEGNTCQGNKGAGILFSGTAAGIARQNQCMDNEESGIQVSERAKPTLEDNTCQGNKRAGIVYVGTTAGMARQNQCMDNEESGIQVSDQAQPVLYGNVCSKNGCYGIYIEASAMPRLQSNEVSRNVGKDLNDDRKK